jgi:hypothetical protein
MLNYRLWRARDGCRNAMVRGINLKYNGWVVSTVTSNGGKPWKILASTLLPTAFGP